VNHFFRCFGWLEGEADWAAWAAWAGTWAHSKRQRQRLDANNNGCMDEWLDEGWLGTEIDVEQMMVVLITLRSSRSTHCYIAVCLVDPDI
jgi:hypothetical protein